MANKLDIKVDKDNLKVIMTREFDAPQELLWRAYSEAELVKGWWGFEGNETIVEKLDFVEGGEWRYVQTDKEGTTYVMYGKFSNIKNRKHFYEFGSCSNYAKNFQFITLVLLFSILLLIYRNHHSYLNMTIKKAAKRKLNIFA